MDDETAGKLVALTTDLMMVFGRMKRAARGGDVGPVHPGTEFALLDTILRHGCRTVPEIAAWRGVTRQSVQALVNKLIETGVLACAENPNHKSSKRLELTPRGQQHYAATRGEMMSRYAPLKSTLRPGDVEAAVRVMALIAETWETRDEAAELVDAEPA
jgi:DNA-binding MarR family transcriptional regulator